METNFPIELTVYPTAAATNWELTAVVISNCNSLRPKTDFFLRIYIVLLEYCYRNHRAQRSSLCQKNKQSGRWRWQWMGETSTEKIAQTYKVIYEFIVCHCASKTNAVMSLSLSSSIFDFCKWAKAEDNADDDNEIGNWNSNKRDFLENNSQWNTNVHRSKCIGFQFSNNPVGIENMLLHI